MAFDERREYTRVPVRFRALFGKLDEFAEASVSDVSMGGICLLAEDKILQGQRIDVKLDLSDKRLDLEGEVAWTRKSVLGSDDKPLFDIGVKFLNLNNDYRSFLDHMIKRFKERRAYYRHAVHLPVTIEDGGSSIKELTSNLSSSGIFITTARIPEIGALLSLSIELPDGSLVKVEGEVMHNTLEQRPICALHPPGFGMRIKNFLGDGARLYLSYIERLGNLETCCP